MAGYDFEFYETGKISVTAGQKAFTGSGSAWKLRGCEGALVVVVGAGTVNFVSSLSTDAAGEFRTAWAGPTLANASYVMWLPSAVAATALANHQRLAEIISGIQTAQPASDILAALAGLTLENRKLIVATGPKTFDATTLSDFAKGLLTRTAGSQFYGDLGEVPNGQLPARLQAGTGSALASTRDAREFGVFYANTSTTNRPSGSGVGLVFAVPQLSNFLRQFYYERDTNRAWTCNCVNGVFSAWVEMPNDISALQVNLETTSAVELGRGLSGDRLSYIDFHAEGAPGAVDRSARIVRNAGTNGTFQLSNNGTGAISLSAAAGVTIPTGPLNNQWAYDNTTVAAANVYLTSSAAFARSTSSGQFKTDVEDLDGEHRDLIMELRPVWYRSLCELDNPEWSYYGLIAEEVAEIDPRLVHWQTTENQYEEKRSTVTVEDIVTDEVTGEKTVESRDVEIVEQVRHEVELETPRPAGVMYDRIVPHLIAKIQELTARLEALESRS